MEQGPLSDPRLSEIEAMLKAGRFDEAQRLLAEVGALPGTEAVSAYFATRLLFQRGKLDRTGVVERLRDLLARATSFPEAERMLAAAESGLLERSVDGFNRSTRAPAARSVPAETLSMSSASRGQASNRPGSDDEADIPRAPLMPSFTSRSASERPTLEGPTLDSGPLETSTATQTLAPSRPPPRIPSLEIPKVSASVLSAERPRTHSVVDSERHPRWSSEAPTPTASLFEIAAALDAGHAERALELCRNATQAGPELTLLTARALSGLHRQDEALSELDRLLRAPLIEPLVRSSSARLLIELGRPEQAIPQARRAVADDPEDPMARVTCAWALLRLLVRTGDPALSEEAEHLMATTRVREGAPFVLLSALRALSMAERGDAARALTLAQTALEQDAPHLDAISALAIASTRLGRHSDAERAQKTLFELNPDEARATEASVARHAGRFTHTSVSSQLEPSSVWGEIEAELVRGRREAAVLAFEGACVERVRGLARRDHADSWSDLGSFAARTFSELPVLRHFAPYDRSVFSIQRLDAALRVLYGKNARPNAAEPVLALLGAYVGESFRQAFGGEWQGVPLFPFSASVEVPGISVRPCERVLARLRDGLPLELDTPPNLHPGADPLGNSVPLSIGPPAPWDPAPWPSLARLIEVGRLLPQSVVGHYCASELEIPLDYSVSSVAALDRYVMLLLPADAPPDPEAIWVRRASIIVGAYLGEVLVNARGGTRWQSESESRGEAGADRYRLVFADGSSTQPVTRVLDRLAGRRMSFLADYASHRISGRSSIVPNSAR